MDVAVAISDFPRLVEVATQELIKHNLRGFLVGHAGDGNLHALIPYTPEDEESYALSIAVQEVIVEAAISLSGTATGEHGIGIGKQKFMALEHGESLKVMRSIKNALDPIMRHLQKENYIVLSGQGEILANKVLSHMNWEPQIISLKEAYGDDVSRVAPAHAVALIAQQIL